MTKYREILRLTALGLSLRNIEKSLHVSQHTIIKVQRRAKELSLFWPLDEKLTEAELCKLMLPKEATRQKINANSHFLRPSGPHFPASPGHIKRPAFKIHRTETLPCPAG